MKRLLIALVALSSFVVAKELTVSILPQKYFVQKIVEDKFNINVMVKPGFSPATYEPKTSQMKQLSKSSLYLSIGVPFESVWLERFKSSNKDLRIIDTAKGIKRLEMVAHTHHEEHGHDDHDEHKEHGHDDHDEHKGHGHDDHDNHKGHAHHDEHQEQGHDDHHHDGLDPHVWLDPVLVKKQAVNIYEAVSSIDPLNKAFYKENLKRFIKELETLDHQIHEILEDHENKAFMVFHPSWGYFAKRYNLEQIAIETQGKEPKPKELVELIKEAKLHNIKVVFVAPQFSKKSAQLIASSIKGNAVTIDPLSFDYQKNMILTAKAIAQSYEK